MLSEMSEVTELHPVPDAHVPIMQFKFNGVSIDLLYAKLSLYIIPEVSLNKCRKFINYVLKPHISII